MVACGQLMSELILCNVRFREQNRSKTINNKGVSVNSMTPDEIFHLFNLTFNFFRFQSSRQDLSALPRAHHSPSSRPKVSR